VAKIITMRINFVRRNAPKTGGMSSEMINSSLLELSTDLLGLQQQWNNNLVPLIETLPSASASDGNDLIDAFTDGLDGKTLYIDSEATVTSESTYFNSTHSRPNTVKEQVSNLYVYIDSIETELREEISAAVGVLTETQKARIGMNIFDTTQSSSALSLDGVTATSKQNIYQIAKDLYDTTSGYTLVGDGDPILTNSIRDHIVALFGVHNGTWDSDLDLSHSGMVAFTDVTGTLPQIRVDKSSTYNDTYNWSADPIRDTEDDLNQLRTIIKNLAGTASFTSYPTDWAATTIGVQDIADWQGNGVRSASNPWGYRYDDITGPWTLIPDLAGKLNNIVSYIGAANYNDVDPNYTSVSIISQGGTLTSGIGALDYSINLHHTNTSNPHSVTLTQAETAGGVVTAAKVTIADGGGYLDAINAETAIQEVMSGLTAHTSNTSNPHTTTANQIGADNIITELNAFATTALNSGVLPVDIVYDDDLTDHMKGSSLSLPSGEHWAADIDCSDTSWWLVQSGVGNAKLNTVIDHIMLSEDARRADFLFSGFNTWDVIILEHNAGMYPMTQILQTNPSVVVVSLLQFTITHDSVNQTSVENLGGYINSGQVIFMW